MTKTFPTLYKKTATGAMQFWTIGVDERYFGKSEGVIVTIFGQVGTDKPQKTEDSIFEGKNVGKKNETTPVEQAIKEAEAQWLKKKKKGYVEDEKEALASRVDASIILGGTNPMLAENFNKQGQKISLPCYGQPKFDGIRCIATIEEGKASLWTRTRKPIRTAPHIISYLEELFPDQTLTFDGELYNHDLRDQFNTLISMIRPDEPRDNYEDIHFYIYDIVDELLPYEERYRKLWNIHRKRFMKPLVAVPSTLLRTREEIVSYFEKCLDEGYEGTMLRNTDGRYIGRRSPDLQKIKDIPEAGQSAEEDDDFRIVGIEEGKGKLRGHVGSFRCETKAGVSFTAKLKGKLEFLKTCFDNPSLWENAWLVVRFQGYTKDGKPRFPRGLRIRESIDF